VTCADAGIAPASTNSNAARNTQRLPFINMHPP
jgi:hypothetical protein